MQIRLDKNVSVFCIPTEDLYRMFNADMDEFLTAIRCDPLPFMEFFMGLLEKVTGFVGEQGELRLVPVEDRDSQYVILTFIGIKDRFGRELYCNNPNDAIFSLDTRNLSEVSGMCGLDVGGMLDYFMGDEDEYDDQPDPTEEIPEPEFGAIESETRWEFSAEAGEERNGQSIRDLIRKHVHISHIGQDSPGKKAAQGPSAAEGTKKTTQHKKAESVITQHYRVLDANALIRLMDGAVPALDRYTKEVRVFTGKNKGVKFTEYYVTVELPDRATFAKYDAMLSDYATPVRMPRGEVVRSRTRQDIQKEREVGKE